MKFVTTYAISILTVLLLIAPGADADFDLSWHKISGGGGTSSGDLFSLSGTIGQHDPGTMSGGELVLHGGFWSAGLQPSEPSCPLVGDLNCDGQVDGLDLLLLLTAWGECVIPADCPADLNSDGSVDGLDLLILLTNWG